MEEKNALEKERALQSRSGKRQRQILLVADEDAAYRSEVAGTFRELFQVVEAETVQATLDSVTEYQDRISAVLLSATLPEPGGVLALNEIKRNRGTYGLPIIMTGPPDALLEEKALVLGADVYVDKPHTQKSLWTQTLRAMGTTSSQAWERSLEEEAYRDYQTGLLNRRGLSAAVGTLKEEDTPLAVFLFDLDNLKLVNDHLGHGEGDRLIEAFSTLLHSHTRESDILSRYGGDEFVVVMKQMRSEKAALKKGEEICRAFQKIQFAGGIHAACTAGIAFSLTGESVADLVALADQALYSAKADGKGRCRLWKG